jgi:hypothetical protein
MRFVAGWNRVDALAGASGNGVSQYACDGWLCSNHSFVDGVSNPLPLTPRTSNACRLIIDTTATRIRGRSFVGLFVSDSLRGTVDGSADLSNTPHRDWRSTRHARH